MSIGAVDLIVVGSTGLLVFALSWSGAAKLGRRRRTLDAMAALRVPAALRTRAIAALVPVWELLLALLLAFGATWVRSVAAAAAALTFAVFTVLLLGVLRRGDDVDCDCFGRSAGGGRVSGWSIWRNAVLVVAALAVSILGSAAPPLFVGLAQASRVGEVTLLLTWALLWIVVLLRSNLALQRELRAAGAGATTVTGSTAQPGRLPGSPAGMGHPIPAAELVSGTGAALPLERIGKGLPVLLLFVSAECGSCAEAATRIPGWEQRIAPIRLVVATSSRPDVLAARLPEASSRAFYGSRSARDALGVRQSPAAVVLGGVEQPVVASGVAHGLGGIEALIASLERATGSADSR